MLGFDCLAVSLLRFRVPPGLYFCRVGNVELGFGEFLGGWLYRYYYFLSVSCSSVREVSFVW